MACSKQMSGTINLKWYIKETKVLLPEDKASAKSALKLAVDGDGTITKLDGVSSDLKLRGIAGDLLVNTSFLMLDLLPLFRKDIERKNDGNSKDGPILNEYVLDVIRRVSNAEVCIATANGDTKKMEEIVKERGLAIKVEHSSRLDKIRNNDILSDDSLITYAVALAHKFFLGKGATPILMSGDNHNKLFVKLVAMVGGRTASNKEEYERQLGELGIVLRKN